MAYVKCDETNDIDLICQYVLDCRGSGHFLPYSDHEILVKWLKESRSVDQLLIVLDDILPEFFEQRREKSVTPSLQGVDRKVRKRLENF